MEQKIPLVVIVGPTASGKTGLSIKLAKEFDAEIISADSMQIYKYMNIGTAKPTTEEMDGVAHHLIDFLNPDEEFSVAQYLDMARARVLDIHARGKLPIVVGGTGLYISSLVDNLEFAETGSSTEIRRKYTEIAKEHGNDYLLELLAEVDPQCAEKLHSNNLGRIIRALEIYELTGRNMTWHKEHSRLTPSPYNTVMIGLDYSERTLLNERINHRVDVMVQQGLVEEAQELFSSAFSATARQAIGYKELLAYFEGTSTLEECLENIKMQSRRYAKRQLTWFRRDQRIKWYFPDLCSSYDEMFENIAAYIEKSLDL